MSDIISEFKKRLKNESIKGLYQWFLPYDWQERNLVIKLIEELQTKSENFTIKQQNIMHLLREDCIGILNLFGTQLNLSKLDKETIDEIILFYNLKNPTKRYKQIQTAINGPQSFLTYIPYSILYTLYQLGKVPFDRQIFVACLIRYNVWHGAVYKKELSPENALKFENYFPQDDFTIDILLAVFEMELGVNRAFYLDREHDIGAVIFALIKNGKYTKTQIQQKIFEAFNNPLLKQSTHAWMKNMYKDLDLSMEDDILQQEQIIALLSNDINLVANHAIQLIKKISKSPKFDWKLLVDALEGIVYREKFNGGLKTLLDLLYKKLQKDTTLLETCCVNLAPIFLQTDSKVQIAAKNIYKLLPSFNETIKESLLPFFETMHSEVKKDLVQLLGQKATIKIVQESYKQQKYQPKALLKEDELTYINSAEDFIFLTSKVLKSKNFEDYELFLEGLVRYENLKTTKLKELKPALKQATRFLENYGNISSKIGIHHEMVALLIVSWLNPDYQSIEADIVNWENEFKKEPKLNQGTLNVYMSNYWLTHFKQFTRLRQLAKQIRKDAQLLPFLSIPTHNNGQIHPVTLIERLQLYEDAKKIPEQGDFDLALCRLNRHTTTNLPNKTESEYQVIVKYLLDPKTELNLKNIDKLESSWVTAFALKNPTKSINTVLQYRNHKHWLENTTWDWNIKWRDKTKKSAKLELSINYITGNKIRQNGMFTIMPKDNHLSSYLDIDTFFVADASHWFSRNPFLLEILYLKIVNYDFRWLDYLEANEIRSVMAIVLESAKNPKPISKAGYLFLVLSLFSKDKSIRMATLDWLTLLIENKYLDLILFKNTLTKLISNQITHFIPMKRVCEQFDSFLQMQGIYIDILEKTIEALIPQMNTENLPRSFSKLLHYYYEVLNITQKQIPADVLETLVEMQNIATVKKVAMKIIQNNK